MDVKVMVGVASKHGATAEIGGEIARTLAERQMFASVLPLEAEIDAQGYDAFVLGSAVYMGRWLKEAEEFIGANREYLSRRPVWLFSSGPIGDPLKPEAEPVTAAEMVQETAARDHKVFAGRLDKKHLDLGERIIAAAVRAPEGDFRDWPSVKEWATSIADALEQEEQLDTA